MNKVLKFWFVVLKFWFVVLKKCVKKIDRVC